MQTSYTTRPEWSGWGDSNPPACTFGKCRSGSLSYIRVWHRPQGSNLQPARSKRAALNPLELGRHSAMRPLSAVVDAAVLPGGTAPAARLAASVGTRWGNQTRRPRPSQRRALFTELIGYVRSRRLPGGLIVVHIAARSAAASRAAGTVAATVGLEPTPGLINSQVPYQIGRHRIRWGGELLRHNAALSLFRPNGAA
jgi:hypothetical protein